MNKEIPSSRMGMEDPEAAAEEYREKVTQSKTSARRVVNKKHQHQGGFSPRVGSRRWAGNVAKERVWFPAGGEGGPGGKSKLEQLVELGAGKRNPWKFPI